jgi:hypothetical protein
LIEALEVVRFREKTMKRSLGVLVVLCAFVVGVVAQEKHADEMKPAAPPIEASVRRLWAAFQKKDKTTLGGLLDEGFRMFEEGLTAVTDKKAEVNSVDEFDLLSYTLSDFTVKSTGPNSALVTYIAEYEGKSGGQVAKAKSVFGEVWVRSGGGWKNLYLQETYVK